MIIHNQEAEGACAWQIDREASQVSPPARDQVVPPVADSSALAHTAESNGPSLCPAPLTNRLKPQGDKSGKLGAFDAGYKVVLQAQVDETRTKMEDLTQMSSLSPTQENPASAYAHYALRTSVDTSRAVDASEKMGSEHVREDLGRQEPLIAKQHSAITDSTVHTYGEHDTGHVHFDDFAINENPLEENSLEREESMSQDGSFAPRLEDAPQEQPYEPQTPAPPINPFLQKGSVLKSNEMFKATQPSSIGRHILSATSSRPSPDVYNDFTSPGKWAPPSSPLVGRFELAESSPLQSSVQKLLRSKSIDAKNDATAIQVSRTKSFGTSPRSSPQSSRREPEQYVSMQESQERRRKGTSSSVSHSDTESESDLDDISTKRQRERRQRDEEIQRELSTVELHKSMPDFSRPVSPGPGDVEIPSTSKGRRRSLQEEYIAQCEGSDARDTQQDDVIVDSQTVVGNAVASRQDLVPASSKDAAAPQDAAGNTGDFNICRSSSLSARNHGTELEPVPDLDPNTHSDRTESAPNGRGSPFQQPDLPLKEVSTNRNDLRTPSVSKTHVFSDGADMAVPETSPSEERIRPMGEIASISFGESNADELQGLPGFTQDTEFESAILPQSSPDPPPRRMRTRRGITHPALTSSATDAECQSVASDMASLPGKEKSMTFPRALPRNEYAILDRNEGESMEPATNHSAEHQHTSHDESGATRYDGGKHHGNDGSTFQLPTRKTSLRSKDELKGPSRSLRRSGADTDIAPLTTPQQPSRTMKVTPATKSNSSRSSKAATASSPATPYSRSSMSTPRSVVTRSCTQKAREETPASTQRRLAKEKPYSKHAPVARPLKRKLASTDETSLSQRESKRHLANAARESSADPLALPHPAPTSSSQHRQAVKLFTKMAFAVSYVNQQDEKDGVTVAIAENGGWILEDGFDILFEPGSVSKSRARSGIVDDLVVSPSVREIGFVALIADEHSRRVKYMQALALGLPCISGKWISECISREEVMDWTPYLLCAGRSSFLGNATRSRTLQPYLAAEATFLDNFAKRKQFLGGKSILAVTGKGSTAEKRQHYIFLMRVLGPCRLEQVPDLKQARKTLLESEGKQSWDLVYVGDNEKHAEEVIFCQTPAASAGSKKRKKGVTPTATSAAPERVRIISDEVVIQNLILGQWLS